jgi:Flp pilus assembly protein TadD
MIKKLFLVLLLVCLPIFSYANTISKCATKLQEGHVNQAIALGKLAVVLHSNNPLSYMCLALAYAKDKHYNFAKVELQQAQILAKSQKLKNTIDNILLRIDNRDLNTIVQKKTLKSNDNKTASNFQNS